MGLMTGRSDLVLHMLRRIRLSRRLAVARLNMSSSRIRSRLGIGHGLTCSLR